MAEGPAAVHPVFHHDGGESLTGLLQLIRAAEHIQHNPPGPPEAVADHIKGGLGETARKGWKSPPHDFPAHLTERSQEPKRFFPGLGEGSKGLLHWFRAKGPRKRGYKQYFIDPWKDGDRFKRL